MRAEKSVRAQHTRRERARRSRCPARACACEEDDGYSDERRCRRVGVARATWARSSRARSRGRSDHHTGFCSGEGAVRPRNEPLTNDDSADLCGAVGAEIRKME